MKTIFFILATFSFFAAAFIFNKTGKDAPLIVMNVFMATMFIMIFIGFD